MSSTLVGSSAVLSLCKLFSSFTVEWGAQRLVYSVDTPSWQAFAPCFYDPETRQALMECEGGQGGARAGLQQKVS